MLLFARAREYPVVLVAALPCFRGGFRGVSKQNGKKKFE
jgi:hypothetical protein